MATTFSISHRQAHGLRRTLIPILVALSLMASQLPIVGAISASANVNANSNLDQWSNGAPGTDPATAGKWQNGNLGENDSQYAEGDSVAFRREITGNGIVSGGIYRVTIAYDTVQQGSIAYDYLTSWNRTEPEADPLSGKSGYPAAPHTLAIPTDPRLANSPNFDQNYVGQRDMAIFGGELLEIGPYRYSSGNQNQAYPTSGTVITEVDVTFRADQAKVMLAWGGHLAKRSDWDQNTAVRDISGSPYHMRTAGGIDLLDAVGGVVLDSGNFGAQDRSLKASAVLTPGLELDKSVIDADGVTHQDGPLTVGPDGSFTYALTVTNSGEAGSTLSNVRVEDEVPAPFAVTGVTTDPVSTACAASSGQTVDCTFPTLAGGESTTVLIAVEVDLDVLLADGCGEFPNLASATSGEFSEEDGFLVTVEGCEPDLDITKTASQTEVELGDRFTYTIEATNGADATAPAINATVTDTVTSALDVTDATYSIDGGADVGCDIAPKAADGTDVSCGPADLAPGRTMTVTIDVTVPRAANSCGPQPNVAQVTADNGSAAIDDEDAIIVDIEGCETDLSGDKTLVSPANGQIPAEDGAQATFEVSITNDDEATLTATGVTITDTVPAALVVQTPVNWVHDGGSDGTCTVTGQLVECGPFELEPGQTVTATIDVELSLAALSLGDDGDVCGVIDNTASFSALEQDDIDDATDGVTIVDCGAEVSIDKVASEDTVDIDGGQLTYTVTATNDAAATATATDVTIEDELAALWDLDDAAFSATYRVDGGAVVACDLSGRTVTCGPADLAPGSSVVATIVVVASPDGLELVDGTRCGTVDNTAELFLDGELEGDASADGVVVDGCDAVLSLDKSADTDEIDLRTDDPSVTYTITAANAASATQTATGVVVTDFLPSRLELDGDATWEVRDGDTLVDSGTCTESDAIEDLSFSCDIGDLAPGHVATVTVPTVLVSTVDVCGDLRNSALLDADQLDAPTGGDLQSPTAPASAVVSIIGCVADIGFDKSVDDDELEVGSDEERVYTLRAVNGEDATATAAVTISDTVPSVFEIVSVDPESDCEVTGQVLECTSPVPLGPGDAYEVTITVALAGGPDASQCGVWTNEADAAWATGYDDDGVEEASADVAVSGCDADIELVKTAAALTDADGLVVDEVVQLDDPDGIKQLLVVAGDTDAVEIAYTFRVTNTGSVTLYDVALDDPLLGGPIALTSTTLAPGGFATGIATYELDRVLDVEAGEVLNVATATGSTDTGEEVNGTDDELVEVLEAAPGIAVDKTVDVPVGDDGLQVIEIEEGDTATLTYTYVVRNTGNEVLVDLSLVDDKLPGVDLTGAVEAAASAAYPDLAAELGTAALPVDGSVTVTAEYLVTAADIAAGSVTNVALAGGTGIDSGRDVSGDDTVTVFIVEVLDVIEEPPAVEPPPVVGPPEVPQVPVEVMPAVLERTLPRTGFDGDRLLALGVLLAALGAAALLFTPRRRRSA